jgi:RimJ/RimL family protein N-acetyltransferase
VFIPDYPVRTDRLLLRPLTEDDYEDFHALLSDPDVARYLLQGPFDWAATRTLLTDRMNSVRIAAEGDRLSMAVELRETGAMVGTCSLLYRSAEHRQGEIGYLLLPKYHRKGYASEAARELLRLGFEGLKLHRIVGCCDGRNTGSAAVLARIGMRQEAHFVLNEFIKGEWTDELVYAMLATEWHDRTR